MNNSMILLFRITSPQSSCSFFQQLTLLLATLPIRTCFAQSTESEPDLAWDEIFQGLFGQPDHRIYHGMENLPGPIVNEHWDEVKNKEILEAGNLLVVDRILEPQTIPHFVEFCILGNLPDSRPTNLTLLSEDDIPMFVNEYSSWAPPPYNKLPAGPMQRVMIRIGSNEDDARLVVTEKQMQAMKSRLWEGIIPFSNNRWRAKKLDDLENFGLACQYLSAVISTFDYLHQEKVAWGLKETFNLISKELKDFENALNAVKRIEGKGEVNITALWEEFIRISFNVMTTRAHSWVIKHVKELRVPILKELAAHEPQSYSAYDPEQWIWTNKLHDLTELAARADFTILLPMDGYIGYTPPPNATAGQGSDLLARRQHYSLRLKTLSHSKTLANIFSKKGAEPKYKPKGIADPVDIIDTYGEQTEAQDQLREEVRGPFTVELGDASPETWIRDLRLHFDREEDSITEWGFMIYRLTHTQTDEEWNAFMQRLEADIGNWGEGVDGANLIKGTARLKWMDGKELGFAEGDVEAAKKHFNEAQEASVGGQRAFSGVKDDIFLYIDSKSVASYASQLVPADMMPAGDFGGFVTAVEVNFDPNDPGDHADESPGFTGHLRILGALIWSDLYALAQVQTAYPEDLWPLAMHHPWKVFVGPLIPAQKEMWKDVVRSHNEVIRQVNNPVI